MRAKDAFLQSNERENWEKITQTKAFEIARDQALLELVLEQPTIGTPEKGWDAHSQVVGARRFIEILSNLHLKETVKPAERIKNLPIPS